MRAHIQRSADGIFSNHVMTDGITLNPLGIKATVQLSMAFPEMGSEDNEDPLNEWSALRKSIPAVSPEPFPPPVALRRKA